VSRICSSAPILPLWMLPVMSTPLRVMPDTGLAAVTVPEGVKLSCSAALSTRVWPPVMTTTLPLEAVKVVMFICWESWVSAWSR
jgi:hypothetical protein